MKSINTIIRKIEEKIGVNDIVSKLGMDIRTSELNSLLLEVACTKSKSVSPQQVMSQYESDRFVRPSSVSMSALLEFDQRALSLLPKHFEPLVLSPVAPFGSTSAITTISQNAVLSTTRNSEVIADATNVLTLEACQRRKSRLSSNVSPKPVYLATSQRHLRTPPFEDEYFTPHFQVFCLVSSGKDTGHFTFERDNLIEHIMFYHTLLQNLFGSLLQFVVHITEWLKENPSGWVAGVMDMLKLKGCQVVFDTNRTHARSYYSPVCFKIFGIDHLDNKYEFVDGGFTDWSRVLLSSRKERLLSSGVGCEYVCKVYANLNADTGRQP